MTLLYSHADRQKMIDFTESDITFNVYEKKMSFGDFLVIYKDVNYVIMSDLKETREVPKNRIANNTC